jgi:S-adenosylhomocysteine hydrolase
MAKYGRSGHLAGFTMASVQHLFPSTMALYDALEAGGLTRPATGVGGKNYSANPDVTARMQAEGWHVAWQAHPTPQAAGLNAEQTVYEMAVDQLRKLFEGCDPARETKPRFLLLDDGGKLIRALHDRFPEYAHLVVAVEQTDRGIQVIEQMEAEGVKLRCPVVDMARSPVKKDHEAPMIGEAIVANALAAVDGLGAGLAIEPKTATMVGFGAIGEATARALLHRGYQVFVTDPSPEAMARAAELGCTPRTRDEALGSGQILFSCTGRTTMTPDDYAKLPSGCVLVNGASGNHELGLHEVPADFFARRDPEASRSETQRLRSTFRGQEVDLGDALADDAMLHRVLRDGDHEVLVLRSGYVINMTDGLPPEYVQLVLGLLWASCAQAVDEKTPGLVPLQDGPAAFLRDRTEHHLAAQGLSLETPDFSRLPSWRL